jgi:hypothetical protein
MVMQFGDPDTYGLLVAGPDAIAGCGRDAEITLRVDGKPLSTTARNALDGDRHELNLIAGG